MILEIIIPLVAVVILLMLSALFSGTETGYTSIDDVTLLRLVRKNKLKESDKKFWTNEFSLIPTLLVGNNVVNIVATSIITILAINVAKVTPFLSEGASITVITALFTITLLIFGEVLPKLFTRVNAETFVPYIFGLAKMCFYLFKPITILLDIITNIVIKYLLPTSMRPTTKSSLVSSMDDITSIINLGHKEGIIIGSTMDLLTGVIDFRNKAAESIMIPRVDMYCIDADTLVKDILALSIETGHSRFPVYDENIDHIIGVFHTKSIFKDYLKNSMVEKKAIDYIMLPYFVPENKPISMLFTEMQKQKLQMVIVIDEYGGTAGLITMEDIIEEIMGEIEDESDKAQSYVKFKGKRAIVNGLAPLDLVNTTLKLDFQHDEYQTIAGYILEYLGRLPDENEKIVLGHYNCRIKKMEDRRIVEVEFIPIKKTIEEIH